MIASIIIVMMIIMIIIRVIIIIMIVSSLQYSPPVSNGNLEIETIRKVNMAS